ncbi:hypothetical protein IU485_02675 [Nocardia cyriacigeorgica]|uniref:hypothetical protein n=1 Tax=Nocardia cyriacigeorgica TaxID=135487 RepID=UPI00189395BA|nr:hypothetical protein [Nocardia cyriacigeorgica]MBF6080255.1 hypothetical protein [Nocardia cyriacigeorgica]
MTAPEPDPVSELRKKLNELVDEATQDGLSRAQLAKKATVSAPVLSKALRDNYELSSWDGVGKFPRTGMPAAHSTIRSGCSAA